MGRHMAELEARVMELELRYTEQQALMEELSEVIAGQQKTIDLLTVELRLLKKKLEGEPGVTDSGAVERPPHGSVGGPLHDRWREVLHERPS